MHRLKVKLAIAWTDKILTSNHTSIH